MYRACVTPYLLNVGNQRRMLRGGRDATPKAPREG